MKVNRRVLKEAAASLLAVFLLLSLGLGSAFAQSETGRLTVKATDTSGAAVAGAAVTVKSLGTTAERKTTTNEEGIATITNLQPGRYEVTVTGTGFAPFVQQAEVTVGGSVSVEAGLSAQAKGETITVVAGEGGVEVNTPTQKLAGTVLQKKNHSLPHLNP